jgi:hypothetical protein
MKNDISKFYLIFILFYIYEIYADLFIFLLGLFSILR